MESNNLAHRLHRFFTEARQQNHAFPTEIVLYTAFKLGTPAKQKTGGQLSPNERIELYRELANLQDCLDEVELQIKELKGPKAQPFVQLMPVLRNAFAISNLGEQWGAVAVRITGESLILLNVIAGELSDETEANKDELAGIKDEISSLLDLIRSSTIDARLRKWLLQLLAEMEAAINRYWYCGARALRDAALKGIAEVSLYHHFLKAEVKAEAEVEKETGNPGTFSRIVSLMKNVTKLFNTSANLIDSGNHLLHSAAAGIPEGFQSPLEKLL